MRERELATDVADAELVADLRAGDRRAMAELYARHRADAVRVGRLVHPDGDPEELTSEAFARVFTKIIDGGGPTGNFRAYLHTVIRNLKIERIRQTGREQPASDKPWLLDAATVDEPEVDDIDTEHAARALRSLPQNWQQLLWRLEVQGRKPADVAAEMHVPVATISDTAYRAREGLRVAYLNQHLPAADDSRCEWTRERLSRLARGSLSSRASAKARHHLDGCAVCAGLYDELHQLNTKLGATIWPIVLLGGTALGGLAGSSEPSSSSRRSTRTSSGRTGISRWSVTATTPATAIAVLLVVTLVAGVAAVGLGLLRDDDVATRAEAPARHDSASPQVLPPPSDDRLPETIDDPSPDVDDTTATRTTSRKTLRAGGASEQHVPPAEEPDPDPPGGPDPVAEPAPVDLEVGAPTVDATGQPDQWLLTVPVLATEDGSSTSFTIDLELSLDETTSFIERQSAGWDCGPIQDGDTAGNPYFFDSVTCQYAYEPGQAVAPLQLVLGSIGMPSGGITVSGAANADPDSSDNHREF